MIAVALKSLVIEGGYAQPNHAKRILKPVSRTNRVRWLHYLRINFSSYKSSKSTSKEVLMEMAVARNQMRGNEKSSESLLCTNDTTDEIVLSF